MTEDKEFLYSFSIWQLYMYLVLYKWAVWKVVWQRWGRCVERDKWEERGKCKVRRECKEKDEWDERREWGEWAVHRIVWKVFALPSFPYIYISYIKFNVVTLYERILTCFIIYKNAILTFLTLFVKYVLKKNY
jgi:hypothetical protein